MNDQLDQAPTSPAEAAPPPVAVGLAPDVPSPPAPTLTRRPWFLLTPGTKLILLLLAFILVPFIGLTALSVVGTTNAEQTAVASQSPAPTPTPSNTADVPATEADETWPALAKDITLGAPRELGFGNQAVPVTVTNTSDTVSDFRLVVLALDSGSGLSSGQKMVSFEQVTPGASASVEIVFHHPQGWTGRYEVASASRTPSVALDGAAEGSQP